MGSDTDSLPALDEADFADTIVLTESDVMATREMRQLLDPNAAVDDEDEQEKDAEES